MTDEITYDEAIETVHREISSWHKATTTNFERMLNFINQIHDKRLKDEAFGMLVAAWDSIRQELLKFDFWEEKEDDAAV